MAEHPIQSLMNTAMTNLEHMIKANTIVGDPIESPDGSVILPVSKVGFGFAAGGSQFGDQEGGAMPFGGGSGGGVSINPVAFLVVSSQGIKVLHLAEQAHILDKVIDLAPQAVDKVQQMMNKKKEASSTRQNVTM
ncbi:GerW family sporulation protein [Priestia taiwanensis]|uniref:Sporulation protein YtfJ n=1 Tax=Priestia taiwanensis TaxID=1347902 RepID=A0A917AX33_9BACI|nr:GerW family sporulation protein [Priestia taiwanensis]MBM7363437.1 sporulation protein YtfJ [Priestia taiwanensis]GGE77197.1 sporulation protein YtfJ [Priestia taiwanensis]